MQLFWFSPADTVGGLRRHSQRGGLRLIPIPKGTLPTARRASVKELGVLPYGYASRGANPKILKTKYNFIF